MVKIIVDIQYFIYNIEFIHKRQRIYNEKQGNKYNGKDFPILQHKN